MCLYSRLMPNPKYKANEKNGGKIPKWKDERTLLVPIGCGKCIECKKQKAREWQIRLTEDVKYNQNGVFVTLTFSNEEMIRIDKEIDNKIQGYARDNAIAKLAVKWWRERWRKRTGKSPRHWLITELGHKGTERIHLHGIVWTDEREYIKKHWDFGFVWIQKKNKNVGGAITNYITKYITKTDLKHKEYKAVILTSSGIGKDFVKNDKVGYYKYRGKETNEQYLTSGLIKVGMPIYYRNKLWTDEERERLWINSIEKETRYVLGKEVSIKEGLDKYFEILMEARIQNRELGYDNDEKNWSRIAYENSIRNLLRKNLYINNKINLVDSNNNNTFDITKYQSGIEELKNVF